MFDVGRVCVKLAGRDAGQKCVIVEVLDDRYVLIDGMTRRRKCNMAHIEPTNDLLELSANASHEAVAKAFKDLGLEVKTTTKKEKMQRKSPVRKQHQRAASKTAKPEKKEKKPAKSAKPTKEESAKSKAE